MTRAPIPWSHLEIPSGAIRRGSYFGCDHPIAPALSPAEILCQPCVHPKFRRATAALRVIGRAGLFAVAVCTALTVRPGYAESGSAAKKAGSAAAKSKADETAALRRALQVLVVSTPGWDAPRGIAQRFFRETTTSTFHRVGEPLPVWVGRSGLAWRSDAAAALRPAGAAELAGPRKQEGDGRSPAGILTLGAMWGYADAPPAGVKLPYTAATELDRCVDDAGSPFYNRLTRQPTDRPPPWKSAEAMRLPTEHYKQLVVMNYNNQTPRRGAGSCIFLHIAPPPGGPTAGCTALAESDLLTVLRWLDPAQAPVILQLPTTVLTAAGAAWGIPNELLISSN